MNLRLFGGVLLCLWIRIVKQILDKGDVMRKARSTGWLIVLSVLLLLVSVAQAGTVERVSVASNGNEANAGSIKVAISGDGKIVAFASGATNLVAGDTNGVSDIFIHDRATGLTQRISVSSQGAQANGVSHSPALSGDGRYVAFGSDATNLVAGDTNGWRDVFVHDRITGTTERVSVSSSGAQANEDNYRPSISSDGNLVMFKSYDPGLVSGNTQLGAALFVRDRAQGTTALASIFEAGASSMFTEGKISSDGSKAAFHTVHTKLFGQRLWWYVVYTHDLGTGQSNVLSIGYQPGISGDGRYVAYYSTPRYIRKLYPAFDIGAEVGGVFIHDTVTDTITFIHYDAAGNPVNTAAFNPVLSADGRYVAYQAGQIYLYDRQLGTTEIVSVDSNGTPGNAGSYIPSMSADAGQVAFLSDSANLVPGDTNGVRDSFVNDYGPSLPQTPDELGDLVLDLLASGEIDNHGIGNSLLATLNNAQSLIDAGDASAALNLLETFIKKVKAQAGKHITEEAAAALIEAAEYLISKI
jgi:Tol biopolymer transport system component